LLKSLFEEISNSINDIKDFFKDLIKQNNAATEGKNYVWLFAILVCATSSFPVLTNFKLK